MFHPNCLLATYYHFAVDINWFHCFVRKVWFNRQTAIWYKMHSYAIRIWMFFSVYLKCLQIQCSEYSSAISYWSNAFNRHRSDGLCIWVCMHGPLTRYVKLWVAHARGMPGTFPRHRGLAIPTCITARAWRTCRDACWDASQGFPLKLVAGKPFPVFPAHAQRAILRIWQEAHDSRIPSIPDAYTCTAVNIEACLKDMSGLYWNTTIAHVLDENEVVELCL